MSDAITLQGGLLSGDFLERLRQGDAPGCKARDYDVPGRLEDRITSAWNDLQNAWRLFQLQRGRVAEDDEDDAYRVTRDHWLRYLFDALRYGHLTEQAPLRIEGTTYPIRFSFQDVPIQVVAFSQDLDKGPDGTARGNPHSRLQQYVNHPSTPEWGILTNGLRWRLLRDNAASTRPAYIEFDLESMMGSGEDGDGQFDVFGLFWRIAHASRITGESPWLEKWMREADRQGIRALEGLRGGVTDAIELLGAGFLKHPKNQELRDKLEAGDLSAQEYFHQVLRLVYRLLFLFVTEDRGLLLDPAGSREAKETYQAHYGTQRLRRLAREVRGSQHHDLFESLKVVMDGLKSTQGCTPLALPPLNSALWSKEFIPDLDGAHIRNLHFLQAIRKLSRVKVQKQYRNVDYKNLGSEELGGVYESLLELSASVNPADRHFRLVTAAGNERKTTGSYYTPSEIVNLALDETLDPILAGAGSQENPEEALLSIRVCDPTCGSGHFLIGAAHRIAKRLAEVRTGEAEPVAQEVQHALRDVISHCIYGVDINPMSVELCKVSLWLEAMEPGKPLAFLEHRIKVGNAFMGATPKMLEAGIPDAAYKVLDLDDSDACKQLKKDNKDVIKALSQATRLSAYLDVQERLGVGIAHVDSLPADSVQDIQVKEKAYEDIVTASSEYEQARLALDAICAAWTYIKEPLHRTDERGTRLDNPHITTGTMVEILDGGTSNPEVKDLIEEQRDHPSNRFFHWHLEFPDMFRPERGPENHLTGWVGGFDAIVGNPPWERPKLQEQEWFAARRPEIAEAPNAAARKRMIAALEEEDPGLMRAFLSDRHMASATTAFLRGSDGWPLTGHGDLNTYSVIAELSQNLIAKGGRTALVLPTQICTDHTTRRFISTLVQEARLRSVTSFENGLKLFPSVNSRIQFCVFVVSREPLRDDPVRFVFFALTIEEARAAERRYHLTPEMVARMNPNTGTAPVFKSKADADLAGQIYSVGRPLILDDGATGYEGVERNPYNVSFQRMFDMANDSGLFISHEGYEHRKSGAPDSSDVTGEPVLPLYEAKMFHLFDHRFGTYEGQTKNLASEGHVAKVTDDVKSRRDGKAEPRYVVAESGVMERERGVWPALCWRDIARGSDQRTLIVSLAPRGAYNNKLPLLHSDNEFRHRLLLLANLGSVVLDYTVRTSLSGTNVAMFVLKQVPVLPPNCWNDQMEPLGATIGDFALGRISEMVLTDDVAMQGIEPAPRGPYRWDPQRRPVIQAELDAAFCLAYGLDRDRVVHLLDSFNALGNQETRKYGEYRTKRLVLEAYDAMVKAREEGGVYETSLDPPPGDERMLHSAETITTSTTQVSA